MGNNPHKNLSISKKQQIEVNSPQNFEPTQTTWQIEEESMFNEMSSLESLYLLIQKKVKSERKKLFKTIQIPKIPFKSIYDDIDHVIRSSDVNTIFNQTKQCVLDYITLILRIRKKLLTLYDTHLALIDKANEKFKESIHIKNKLIALKELVEQLMPFYSENDFLQSYHENNSEDLYTFILQKWVNEELEKS